MVPTMSSTMVDFTDPEGLNEAMYDGYDDNLEPGGWHDYDELTQPPKPPPEKRPRIEFPSLATLPPLQSTSSTSMGRHTAERTPSPTPPPPTIADTAQTNTLSALPPSQPRVDTPSVRPHIDLDMHAIEQYQLLQRLQTSVEISSKQLDRSRMLLSDLKSDKPRHLKDVQYMIDITFTCGNMFPALSREIRVPAGHCQTLNDLCNSVVTALRDVWFSTMGQNFLPTQQGCIYLEETVLRSRLSPYGLMHLTAEATNQKYAEWRKRNVVNGFAKTLNIFMNSRIQLTPANPNFIGAHRSLAPVSRSSSVATKNEKLVYSQSRKKERVEKSEKKKQKRRATSAR